MTRFILQNIKMEEWTTGAQFAHVSFKTLFSKEPNKSLKDMCETKDCYMRFISLDMNEGLQDVDELDTLGRNGLS